MKKLFFAAIAVIFCSAILVSCTETSLNDDEIEQVDLSKVKDRPGNGGD